jgi:beta-lactamase regulating signal transducer with metallopeptidase domain
MRGINICIFWFHPLAWWIDRELARLAVEACDDVAVSKTKAKEKYAATLVDVARTAAGLEHGLPFVNSGRVSLLQHESTSPQPPLSRTPR